MAEKKYIELWNTSNEAQNVFDDSTQHRYEIPPDMIMAFPEKIAALFLANRGRYVHTYEPSRIPDVPGEDKTWIANMTGNPFAPDMKLNRKGNLVPNPNKIPQVLKRKMHTSQETIRKTDSVIDVYNYPPVDVIIPPFKRIRIPISLSIWLQQRDSQQEPEGIGKLMACRAPTNFEPNETWNYDELRFYAFLVDPKHFDVEKLFPPASVIKDAKLEDDKKSLLRQMLFFRIVDDKFELPSSEFFKGALADWTRNEKDVRKNFTRQPVAPVVNQQI